VNAIAENVRRPVILLAEDEAIIALELADSLIDAGFDVAGPFATCSEAEAWLKTGNPDAAILDNLLKDGPCDAMAADLSRRGVPLILFSGQDAPDASADWTATWVTKPVATPILIELLKPLIAPTRTQTVE
jgi:DNA-binding response OmpR family regulator